MPKAHERPKIHGQVHRLLIRKSVIGTQPPNYLFICLLFICTCPLLMDMFLNTVAFQMSPPPNRPISLLRKKVN